MLMLEYKVAPVIGLKDKHHIVPNSLSWYHYQDATLPPYMLISQCFVWNNFPAASSLLTR